MFLSQNPTLVMEILKYANSCYYRRNNEITKVEMAVNIMGINYLTSLIQTVGVQQAIDKKYSNLKRLWDHSQKIALKSVDIVNKFKLREIEDFIYVAALLHDIGKVVLFSLHKETFIKINHSHNNINDQILESILEGVTHTLVGSMMAKKWRLPDQLAKAIEYHHDPMKLDPKEDYLVQQAVFVIYYSHILLSQDEENSSGYDYEQEVRAYFKKLK